MAFSSLTISYLASTFLKKEYEFELDKDISGSDTKHDHKRIRKTS